MTIVNDDGRVKWTNLTVREKVARTTQQTFNLGLIITGVCMTVSFSLGANENDSNSRREECVTFSIVMSFHQIAKQGYSTVRPTESNQTVELWSYLGQANRL